MAVGGWQHCWLRKSYQSAVAPPPFFTPMETSKHGHAPSMISDGIPLLKRISRVRPHCCQPRSSASSRPEGDVIKDDHNTKSLVWQSRPGAVARKTSNCWHCSLPETAEVGTIVIHPLLLLAPVCLPFLFILCFLLFRINASISF